MSFAEEKEIQSRVAWFALNSLQHNQFPKRRRAPAILPLRHSSRRAVPPASPPYAPLLPAQVTQQALSCTQPDALKLLPCSPAS